MRYYDDITKTDGTLTRALRNEFHNLQLRTGFGLETGWLVMWLMMLG